MPTDILDPNPFRKPIIATLGDLVARDTYASVGAALTNWEFGEAMFGSLYSAFVKPVGGTVVVLRAYGAILAAGSRRDMIAEAAEAYFAYFPDATLPGRVNSLLNLYKDAGARLNEIAHGIVMGLGGDPIQYFLIPSLFASRKRDLSFLKTTYQLRTREIDHYGACFSELSSRAGKIMQDVRTFYEALPQELKERFA